MVMEYVIMNFKIFKNLDFIVKQQRKMKVW